MKRLTILFVFLVLSVFLVGALSVQAQGRPDNIATHIIVFHPNVNARAAAADLASAHGLGVTNIYQHALQGMAAVVPAGRVNALSRDPRVASIEVNMEVHISAQEVPTGVERIFADQTALDIDGADDFRVDVDVAVIDTGVDFEHPDLNVAGGVNCTSGGPLSTSCVAGGDDDHYHGTHVAGTIGALDNGIGVVGVAPGARIWAVKVLSKRGSGYTNWIVGGIDWVVGQGNIEVINMSLGGAGISTAYETAINNAVANGVVVVVAAGNEADDANGYSPAFVPAAITVSALADFDGLAGSLGSATCRADEDDTLANFSNFGSAVDIIAPGVCITSTYPIEQGSYGTISGTSMASPHVAGAAALLASGANAPQNAADVQVLRNTLVNAGNLNWNNSDDPDGIKERLLDISGFTATLVETGNGGGGDPTPTDPPPTEPPPSGSSMHISALVGSSQAKGPNWSATAIATISDENGNPVSGATVSMDASGDAISGSGSCVTDSTGSCGLTTSNMRNGTYVTFTVSSVSLSGYSYDSASNVANSVTVNR